MEVVRRCYEFLNRWQVGVSMRTSRRYTGLRQAVLELAGRMVRWLVYPTREEALDAAETGA